MGHGPLPAPFPSPYTPPGTPADVRKLIHFATDGVQPPSLVYLDVNDALFVEVWTVDASVVILTRYRILNPAGEIIQGQEQFGNIPANRFASQFQVQLAEGFLLSLELQLDPNQPSLRIRGQTRARAIIIRGTTIGSFQSQVLCQGMLDSKSQLTWPQGLIEPTAANQGYLRSVTGTTPAAGAEISETVPVKTRWQLRTFRYQLTTSVTVANRSSALLVDDGVNTLFQIESGVSQAASISARYSYGLIGARSLGVNGNDHAVPFPNLVLLPGYRIRTSTGLLQAGDQYTAPQYSVEEWFDQ